MNNISGVDFFIMVSKDTLLKLAGEYGTPLYVYDGDEIVRHYQALYDYIDYKKHGGNEYVAKRYAFSTLKYFDDILLNVKN